MAEATAGLTGEQAGEVEARVLPRAGGQTVAVLRRAGAPGGVGGGRRPGRGAGRPGPPGPKLWHFDRRPDGTGTLTSPAGHAYPTEPHRYALPRPRPPAGDEPTSLEASALDEPRAPTAPAPPAAPPKPPPPYDDEPPF